MKPKGQSRLLATSATLIVATFATSSLFAASATWNGTTNATWADDTNWSAAPAPGAGDTATFNNAGNGNTTINLGAGVSIGNISFDTATAASYIIGSGGAGSQTLALGASGSISMAAAVVNNQLINANLSLGTAAGAEGFTITNSKAAASNSLTLAGGVSTLQSGVKTLTIAGTGVTNISGAINDGSGTLALNKMGAQVLTLSGSSNYSGGTLVSGILVAANSSALGSGAVTINAAAGNQLQLSNGVNVANPLAISGGVTAQGIVYVPAGNATYSGTISAVTQLAGGHFATAGYIDNTLTIAGDNTITSAVPITVRNGAVKITGAQSYTGGTSMNGASFIQFGKTTSMPATGSVVTLANGVLGVNAGGAGEFIGGTGAGTIGGLVSGLGGQGAPVTWVANTTLAVDTTNAAGTVTHSAAVTPAVAVGLIKLGAGTLELTGGGTYASTGNIVGNMPLIARQGTLLLNGGTHTVTGEIAVGSTFGTAAGSAGYNAKIQIDSGNLNISTWLSVGKGNGTGVVSSDFVANNGAAITSANLSGGYNNNNAANLPKGSITLNNTASLAVNNNVHIAESPGSNFTLTLNGTSTFSQTANANQTTVGMGANSVGQINVNGGTASFHRDLILGANVAGASGKLILNSGTAHAATTVERWVIINQGNTSSGQIDLNGGNLNLNSSTDLRFSTNATSAGTNSVNLNSGTITGYTGNAIGGFSGASVVDMNNASNAAALNNTFNLAGGTLTIGQVISSNNNGTVAFNFNGGTLRAAASSANFVDLGGANQSVNVLAGGAIIDSNGNNVTVVDVLKAGVGSGGLTKLGLGNLTLGGASTYTGATLVSAGTLTLANTGSVNSSSGITVDGATAKLVQANAPAISAPVTLTQGTVDGTGTINLLTVANSASNVLTHGNGSATALTVDSLNFIDTATVNVNLTSGLAGIQTTTLNSGAAGVGKITINATAPLWAPGTYDLITYSGSIGGGGFAEFQKGDISGLSGRQSAVLTHFPGSSVGLTVTGDNPVWTGALNGDWTTNTLASPKNWALASSGSPTDFLTSDSVIFDDSAVGTTDINISTANVSPLTTTFTNVGVVNGGKDYVIASSGGFGIVSGNVTLNGAGSVTLATPNTYPGGTFLNLGTLNINHASAIGTGALTIAGFNAVIDNTSGAAIALSTNNAQNWNGDFTFLGSNNLNLGTGAVTLNATRSVTVGGSATLSVGGAIAGTGFGLTKAGTGTLVLSGTSTYNGITSLRDGTLSVTAGTTGTLNAAVEISPDASGNGTLNVTGGTLNATRIILGGNNGNNGNPGAAIMTQSAGVVNASQWFTVGSGVGGVVTPAAGTFTMTGGTLNASTVGTQNFEVANFTGTPGTVTMSGASAITIQNNAAIALGANNDSGSGSFTQNGGTVTFYSNAGTTVGGTGALRLGNAGVSPATSSFTYNLNGGVLTVPSVSRNATVTNLSSGNFNFNGGTLKATNATATYMEGLTSANVLTGGARIDDGGFAITVAQPLLSGIAGDGGLTKSGVGTLSLGGTNTYVGPTVINSGALVLTGTSSVNGSSGISVDGSGAKFVQASSVGVTPAITVTNGTFDGAGTVGNVNIAASATNVLANGNGGNAGMTAGNLVFSGAATLNLRPASTATPVIAASSLMTGAPGTITVNASSPAWSAGTYNLITYSGAIGGGGFDSFELGDVTGLTNRQVGSAVLSNPAGAIALTVGEGSVKWTGKVSGAWTTAAIASPKNWSYTSAETDFLTNDVVVFDDSVGAGFTTVDITDANVSPTAANFANNSVPYTVVSPSGRAISGTGLVSKSGTGTVVMGNGGLNNYTGSTTLNGGVFSIATVANGGLASDLGASTNVATNLVFGGGTLQFTTGAAQATDRSFSITPGSSATFDIANAAGILTVNGAVPATTGSLVKTGGGRLTLTGANLYTGGTTVSAGTLESTVNGLNGGGINIASGATVTFTGNNQISTSTVTGAGAILNSTANTIVFTGNHTAFTGTFNHTAAGNNSQFNSAVSGSQSASYTLTAGEFIMAANGDYTVQMGSLSSLAGTIRGGNVATGVTTMEVGHLGVDSVIAGNFNNGNTKVLALTKVGAGSLTLNGNSNYSGATNVNAGTLRVNGALTSAAGFVTVASGATLSGNGNIGGNVTIQDLGHHALDVAANAGLQVTRTVSGVLDLSAVGDILDLTAAAPPVDGTYTLVTATGGLTGVPDSITRTGFTGGTLTFDANSIKLVVGTGSSYEAWVAGFGLAGGDQELTDDPDGDAFNNLFEYVLGGNPNSNNNSVGPIGTKVGDNYVFTFKRTDLSATDTTLTVEYGDNLTVWGSYDVGASPGVAPVAIAENTPTADIDSVTVTIPTNGATNFFARLKVVK
ncbi:MAG: autotransporter-associated beta strand repeat-containing protein [Verrucomicrobiota bacterium]